MSKEKKLLPIAEAVAQLLKEHFAQPAPYYLEHSPCWLMTVPDKATHESLWHEISEVYAALLDNRWTLDQQLANAGKNLKPGTQRFDIWFTSPDDFGFEFDETQHFNQFRLRTMECYGGYRNLPFDYDEYVSICRSSNAKPGTSGFSRLKCPDPLFPPLYEGDKQDNRVRQRAFRDFLKDVIPIVIEGANPTIRVSYEVTNGKRNGFDQGDLEAVRQHIEENRLLRGIRLRK